MKKLMLTAILLIAVLTVYAEDKKSISIDLISAIKMSLDQNPSIASVKENEAAALAKLHKAKSMQSAKMNLNSSYSYVSDKTLFGNMTILDNDTNMNSLSISKPLYTGGMTDAIIDQAKYGISISKEQTKIMQENMIVAVTESFINALNAQDNLRVADDAVAYMQASLDAATKMMNAGTAPKSDVYRAETELASAKEKRINADINYKTQLAVLRDLLNIDSYINLIDKLPDIEEFIKQLPDEIDLLDRAEAKAIDYAVGIAKSGVKKAESAKKPSINVSADFLNIGMGAEFPRKSDTFNIGINISMPLIDGGAAKADVDEANVSLRKAQYDLNAIKSKLELEKEKAFLDLEGANARIETNDVRLKSARESVRTLKISYQEGMAPITDVLGAQAALTEAETAKVNSIYNRYFAEIKILKANGKIMEILNL